MSDLEQVVEPVCGSGGWISGVTANGRRRSGGRGKVTFGYWRGGRHYTTKACVEFLRRSFPKEAFLHDWKKGLV